MADAKKQEGSAKNDALLGAAAQLDGGLAQKLVEQDEVDAPEDKNYPDPEKASSTKPGTKALAQKKIAERLQEEQEKAAKDKENLSKSMGMSQARKDAYATAEAAGNK